MTKEARNPNDDARSVARFSVSSCLRGFIAALCLLPAAGCAAGEDDADALVLATTTSVRDTGLLDVLLPAFRRETGMGVKYVAVGSGQALEIGRRGDADALITHAPAAEKRFVSQGHGLERHVIMSNEFVIVGPRGDPAGIQNAASAADAFRRIAEARAPFVSRGDESGTHVRERRIWELAGMAPEGEWYLEAGTGMAEALRIASEKQACTLSDRGTFLTQRRRLELSVLYEGDPVLENIYSVIAVNPDRHPHVRGDAARRFVAFLLASRTRQRIGEFGVAEYGEPLFRPSGRAGDPLN